jgi:hypothetical protein
MVELEKLCQLHCTDAEIAAWFGVTERTISRRRKIKKFADVMERRWFSFTKQLSIMKVEGGRRARWSLVRWIGCAAYLHPVSRDLGSTIEHSEMR